MPAPDANTFESVSRLGSPQTPHRPSVDDFDGCSCINATNPPDATTMPTAPAWNSIGRTLAAVGRVVPVAVFTVRYLDNTTPIVENVVCTNGALQPVNFQVTSNGVGDVSITWPADSLPPAACDPIASVGGLTPVAICASNITNGVRVVAGSRVRFTVAVY